jgi:hypothetical protein
VSRRLSAEGDAIIEGFPEFVWRRIAPGTPVVVGEGPLQGLRGTILGMYENGRVIVAVTLLRTVAPVEFDPADICFDAQVSAQQLVKH